MRSRLLLILLVTLLSPGIGFAGDPAKPAAAASDELMTKIAKIRVGSSTQSDVAQLLGNPWRTVDTNDDPDDDDYRVWEYVGQNGSERYRIHIGFDETKVVRLIARVRQKGSVEVLAGSNGDRDQHKHDSSVHGHDQ